jgi:hypothetical protein
MLKHSDVWRAIDRIAELNNLSASGLALKAGLSSTAFNPSKRMHGKRKRWPSTESISQILKATSTTLDEFVSLASPHNNPRQQTLPLLGYAQAGRDGFFDDAGYPTGKGWDDIQSPAIHDPHAFVLEVSGSSMEPIYREGDRIIASPAEKPRNGDRVVVRTAKGEVMVKKLGRQSAQKTDLISFNPAFPTLTLNTRDIEWMYRIVWASQ